MLLKQCRSPKRSAHVGCGLVLLTETSARAFAERPIFSDPEVWVSPDNAAQTEVLLRSAGLATATLTPGRIEQWKLTGLYLLHLTSKVKQVPRKRLRDGRFGAFSW